MKFIVYVVVWLALAVLIITDAVQLMDDWYYEHCHDGQPALRDAILPASKVLLFTYVDDNVMSYAQHSIALWTLYARLHGFSLVVFNAEKVRNWLDLRHCQLPVENANEDIRWIKVKLYCALLTAADSQVRSYEYLVWIDADIVPLSFAYDVFRDNDIPLKQPPSSPSKTHDIYLSSEYHAETGVANTGFVVLRNSSFSRRWVAAWFHDVPHSIGHDQIGFDHLYKHYSVMMATDITKYAFSEDIGHHVKILPSAALNSIPPSYLYLEEHHSILHLMGETNRYRELVFARAKSSVCNTLHSRHDGPGPTFESQFGVGREYLSTTLLRENRKQIEQQLLPQVRSLLAVDFSGDVVVWTHIGDIRELLLQESKVLQKLYSDSKDEIAVSSQSKDYFLPRIRIQAELYFQLSMTENSPKWISMPTQDKLQLYNFASMLGNDLLQDLVFFLRVICIRDDSCGGDADLMLADVVSTGGLSLLNSSNIVNVIEIMYIKVGLQLDAMLKLVHPSQTHLVQAMQAMLFMNHAVFLEEGLTRLDANYSQDVWLVKQLYDQALESYQAVTDRSLVNPYQEVDVLSRYASFLCNHRLPVDVNDLLSLSIARFQEAIQLYGTLLIAEQQVKEDHYRLVLLLVQAIQCSAHGEVYSQQTQQWSSQLMQLMHSFKEDSSFQKHVQQQLAVYQLMETIQASVSAPKLATKAQLPHFEKNGCSIKYMRKKKKKID